MLMILNAWVATNLVKPCKDQLHLHKVLAFFSLFWDQLLRLVEFQFFVKHIQSLQIRYKQVTNMLNKFLKTSSFSFSLSNLKIYYHLCKVLIFILCFFSTSCNTQKDDKTFLANWILNGWSNQFLSQYSVAGKENQGILFEENLARIIDSSTQTLYCAFWDVNLPGIIRKLLEAKNRGVNVKVALDEDNRNGIGYRQLESFLTTFGEERKLWIGNRGAGNVYFNACVADNKRVFVSTSPPTLQGFYYSSSYGAYIQSGEDGIVRKFHLALDLMTNGAFGSSRQRLDQRNHWLINSTDIGIYLAPEENPMDFIQKRIGLATESVQLYSTEFFGTKLDSNSLQRTSKDIALELVLASAPMKQFIGSYYAQTTPDPDAGADCSLNEFLGLSCDPNKSAGTSGNSPRRVNSFQYLRNNGIESEITGIEWPSNGINFLILDSNTNSPRSFIGSSPFSKRSDSSHDGVYFIFDNKFLSDGITQFFYALRSKAKALGAMKTEGEFLDIVISEINWMGAYNRNKKLDKTEYIELYNNTNETFNLENWTIECGSNQSFSTIYLLPKNTIIGPHSYFLITDSKNSYIQDAHLVREFGGFQLISDINTDQCRIKSPSGKIIDIAGVSGIPFNQNKTHFGVFDLDNQITRSMERVDLKSSGEQISNWHTNSHSSYVNNINFKIAYLEDTFGTPGYANSANVPFVDLPPSKARSLVINEIGLDSPATNDRWIEIYNPLDEPINLEFNRVFLSRDSSCSLNGSSHTGKVALTGIIPAKGYYLVARNDSPTYASSANLATSQLTALASNCVFLTIGDDPITSPYSQQVIDFVNIGGVGDLENSSFISSSQGAYSRCPNGTDTDVNGNDFKRRPRTPGMENVCVEKAKYLKINEIGINSPAGNDRWIEIYNPLNEPIDLAYNEVYFSRDSNCNLNGSPHTGKIALTGVIPAGGYYYIARSDSPNYASTANITMSGLVLANNCIFLTIGDTPITSPSQDSVIDFVNIGGVGSLENSSFIPSSNGAYSRCPNGTDTNVNGNDFAFKIRSPGQVNLCN